MSELLQLTDEQKQELSNIAFRCLGIKYVYGAKVANMMLLPEQITQIDCSGLTKYLANKINIVIPDGAIFQFQASEAVETPETGDLCFKKENGVVCHVGLIIAQTGLPVCVIEASGSLGQVVYRDLSSFKTFPSNAQFAGVQRLLSDKVKSL